LERVIRVAFRGRNRVGETILSRHYKAHQSEKDNAAADGLDAMMRVKVMIRHHSETGKSTEDVAKLSDVLAPHV
jgi:hypothetical protein